MRTLIQPQVVAGEEHAVNTDSSTSARALHEVLAFPSSHLHTTGTHKGLTDLFVGPHPRCVQ